MLPNRFILPIVLAITFVTVSFVSADPVGPNTITRGSSQRSAVNSTEKTQVSEAGNMTSLIINATSVTQRWQGFYGNITGTITLDDASNNTLYDWQLSSTLGEIYASNGTNVAWSSIDCVNFSANGKEKNTNVSVLNQFIGYAIDTDQGSSDSVNATFNQTYGNDASTFSVGTRTINNADNCSMATLFVSDAPQTSSFKEVLLTDNISIIFTALLERDVVGFSGSTLDFEMVVGVNGTQSGTTRNFYFYIELG